jgi:hypothetical protein
MARWARTRTHISGRVRSIHGQRDGSGSGFFLGAARARFGAGAGAASVAVGLRFAAGEGLAGAGSDATTSMEFERRADIVQI